MLADYAGVNTPATHSWFTLTRARDLAGDNPDILDYSQLTGSRLDVEETRRERLRF